MVERVKLTLLTKIATDMHAYSSGILYSYAACMHVCKMIAIAIYA